MCMYGEVCNVNRTLQKGRVAELVCLRALGGYESACDPLCVPWRKCSICVRIRKE